MAAHVDHGTTGHASADDQYRATPPGAGYEHTDATVGGIVKFLLWLSAAAVVIHIGLGFLFNVFVDQRVATTPPRFPLAVNDAQRLPPEPRLQQFPREDIMNFRLGEETLLRNYGWVNKEAGTVHIPIRDAMRIVLERNMLASRPAPPEDPSDQRPSDASAGRSMPEKR